MKRKDALNLIKVEYAQHGEMTAGVCGEPDKLCSVHRCDESRIEDIRGSGEPMTIEGTWDGYTKKKCSECVEYPRCGMMKIGCVERKSQEE